jgi:hypothetical protein
MRIRIRDLVNSGSGSGMEKNQMQDAGSGIKKHPGSATLICMLRQRVKRIARNANSTSSKTICQ